MRSVVAYDPDGVVVVDTRTWSAVWTSDNQEIPAVGTPGRANFSLAQADISAPVCWSVMAQSNNPLSSLQLIVQVMGVAGSVGTTQGQVVLPYQQSALPGMGIRVLLGGGVFAPGERLFVGIAPLNWPVWARPLNAPRRAGVTS